MTSPLLTSPRVSDPVEHLAARAGVPLVAAVLVAVLVGAVLQALLPPLLLRARAVDLPGPRSSHTAPTPRGGGVAPVLGLLAGAGAWCLLRPGADGAETLVLLAVGAAATAGLVGLVEDLRGVAPTVRLGLQLAVGAVAGAVAVDVLGRSLVWVPVAALAVAAYVNAVNFMDGADTVTALHGVVCGLAYAAAGAHAGEGTAWLVPAGLLLAASGATFSLSNGLLGRPARLFLGDVGSYAVGAAVAVLAGVGVLTGLPVVTALAPTTVWFADTAHTLLLRAAAGERLSEAHRTHAYQRLLDTGLGHRAVGLLAAAATALCAVLGGAALVEPRLRLPVAAALLLVGWLWVKLPAWRGVPSPWGAVARARAGGRR